MASARSLFLQACFGDTMVHISCVRKAAKQTTAVRRLLNSKAINHPPSSSVTKNHKHQPENACQWHAIILTSVIHGSPPQETVALFQHMLRKGVLPNASTFLLILKACVGLSDPYIGQQIHAIIAQLGFESDTFVATALIDMYGKCRRLDDAREVFNKMPITDLVACTTLISACSQNGCVSEAFHVLFQMQMEGVRADLVTLGSLLTACRSLSYLPQGQSVHCLSIKAGFERAASIGNTLIDMYSKCGVLENAVNIFNRINERDVVSWNALLAGFLRNGEVRQALVIFEEMLTGKVSPNRITLLTVAPCCGSLGSCETAKCLHGYVLKWNFSNGTYLDDVALATALVDMHSKCGDLELAHEVFNRIKKKNVVSWSAMIAGYEQALMPEKALQLFQEMTTMKGAITPNEITMVSVLSACSQLGAPHQAKLMHDYVTEIGLGSNSQVASALIDMYAKCGSIAMAREIFSKMTEKSVVSWSAMIGAEGMHGGGRRALELFREMVQHDLRPNEVTFISLLSACSHSGLVNEGYRIFHQMEKDYGIQPALKHYGCMVDILGRAGRLDEAHQLIKSMPMEADAGVWGSLLGACRLYGNCKLGKLVEKQILTLAPHTVGHRVLLANMYAAAGRWDDVVRMRVSLKDQGLKKTAGCSFIEIKNKIHKFIVQDRTHPDAEKIFKQLTILDHLLKDAGYVPNTAAVVYNIEEKLKEHVLMYHSEKLAIAFGIINTRIGETIRITKNLRICDDCHAYSKLVSNVMKRELIIRDAYRFHHFMEGLCSCRDYW